ncbi:hypothetical protein EON67_05525 [archaeon]|nr:MAG: hypothetical protein EON67_05525 [archaeon]
MAACVAHCVHAFEPGMRGSIMYPRRRGRLRAAVLPPFLLACVRRSCTCASACEERACRLCLVPTRACPMSATGVRSVGVPTVLVHEAEGLIVTIETRDGASYRGKVTSAEDSMNMGLRDVTVTDVHGQRLQMERVFIRGSAILFVVYPDILAHAPVFKRLTRAAQGITTAGGLGRGRMQAMEAKCTLTGVLGVGVGVSCVYARPHVLSCRCALAVFPSPRVRPCAAKGRASEPAAAPVGARQAAAMAAVLARTGGGGAMPMPPAAGGFPAPVAAPIGPMAAAPLLPPSNSLLPAPPRASMPAPSAMPPSQAPPAGVFTDRGAPPPSGGAGRGIDRVRPAWMT